jgi:hypothetical protein
VKVFKNYSAATMPKKLKREELCKLSTSELIIYWREYHSNEPSFLAFLGKYVFNSKNVDSYSDLNI